MYVPQFKLDGILYPLFLAATASLVMYHFSVGTHIGQENFVYTKLCKSSEKFKIKDFNSPRNELQIVLDYCSKNIEEYLHLRNPDDINISKNLQHRM